MVGSVLCARKAMMTKTSCFIQLVFLSCFLVSITDLVAGITEVTKIIKAPFHFIVV